MTTPDGIDHHELRHLLEHVQDGVVARRQLLAPGADDHDIARMVRRHELTRMHPGVYVDHTGDPSWQQRAWAAVLVHWPAALARGSALPLPPGDGPVHVAIDLRRTVRPVPGVVAHRTADLDARVRWQRTPPRVALEHAAVDAAAATRDVAAAFGLLAAVCHTRETTPARVREVLQHRRGVRHRAVLLELLGDLADGACSVLEREYLQLERRHGLPVGERQQLDRTADGAVYRDVTHASYGVVVELDGRAHHDTPAARDRDADRDLDAVSRSDLLTLRLTWGQVLGRGCRTAARVAAVLQRRGWTGQLQRCPDCPDVDARITPAW